MKIESSSIDLAAAHELKRSTVEARRVQAWRQRLNEPPAATSGRLPRDSVAISPEGSALLPTPTELDVDSPMSEVAEVEVQLLKLILEALTGQSWDLMTPKEVLDAFEAGPPPQAPLQPLDPTPVPRPRGGERWGIQADIYHSFREQEKTSFQARGVVTTADGREIAIDVELRMARRWAEEHVVSVQLEGEDPTQRMVDPLVINLSGDAAALTSTRFSFDLDVDGQVDQIAMLAPGSAYLALDRNQDGEINDGSELFGPTTGHGFHELAQHDSDANGWIDAGDSIFERLRLWSQRSDGSSRLVGLGSAGVGAIYLGHIQTAFQLNDSQNQALGQVTDSGVFLHEDGRVGTVQDLDLIV